MKTAFIVGISGQDGSYLAKFLLGKNYRIIGLTRSLKNINKINLLYLDILNSIELFEVDAFSLESVTNLLQKFKPDEVYNLSAQSSVGESFNKEIETINYNIVSVAIWLKSIRNLNNGIKFYQASSSEIFGNLEENELPISENNILRPTSPYGISKATAHWLNRNYRESFSVFSASGILFNHESALRGNNYVVKKIITSAIAIKEKISKDKIVLGNISIMRDWGYAPYYVEAMWKILQHHKADDFIICSNNLISLESLIYIIFDELSLNFENHIIISKDLYRPNELFKIYGDNSKAKIELNWNYSLTPQELVRKLINDEYNFYYWKLENKYE